MKQHGVVYERLDAAGGEVRAQAIPFGVLNDIEMIDVRLGITRARQLHAGRVAKRVVVEACERPTLFVPLVKMFQLHAQQRRL